MRSPPFPPIRRRSAPAGASAGIGSCARRLTSTAGPGATGAARPGESWAIDSNSSAGNQSGVTIEYLTIEKYRPDDNSAAINPDSNTGWTIRNNLITLNGQYGFQSEGTNSWGEDAITGGPYGLTIADNEIS
jgi:hypothetical protein